ncbi:unnamed protein product [Clonostachys byssicola]|uniref:Uncharacterized protein n=1 Tax=Clonostachys byssicola TaxID=160290 RepID=A0A9N9Y069_9HYPO|nr:unnamed protein product [Clonostachys byssicola]
MPIPMRRFKWARGKKPRRMKDHLACFGGSVRTVMWSGLQTARITEMGESLSPLPLYHPILFNTTGSRYEQMAFHHAVSCTIQELGDYSSRYHFWREKVPLAGQHEAAVHHALIALGAMHWSFLLQDNVFIPPVITRLRHTIALRHYTLSMQLVQSLGPGTPLKTMKTTLMCCLIFISIENLSGHHVEALRHLQAGCRLLVSLRSIGTNYRNGSNPVPQDDELDELTNLFSRLALDASVFIDDDVLSHFSMFGHPETTAFSLPPPCPGSFVSAAAARDMLHQLEIAHDIFYERVFGEHDCQIACTDSDVKSRHEELPLEFGQRDIGMYRMIHQWFQWWSKSFDLYIATGDRQHLRQEEHLIMKLQLGQKTWAALLKDDSPSLDIGGIVSQSELEAIIEQAEKITNKTGPRYHPTFSFDAQVIISLWYVVAFATDIALMRRATKVLRELRLRGGLWDSIELAEVLEAIMVSWEQHGTHIRGYPGGLLSTAKTLSDFDMTCIKPTNSILILHDSLKA